jgi:hypothetical protein
LDGRPAADLNRRSHTAGGAKEAVTILGSHPQATPGWDRALDAILATDPRTRDSIWAMVANTFSPLADLAVLATVTAKAGDEVPGAQPRELGAGEGGANGLVSPAPVVGKGRWRPI